MKLWTNKEVNFLKESHQKLSIIEIANKLGRTYKAVQLKKYKLGLIDQDRSPRKSVDYAVYKGEELLVIGSAVECAEELNVTPDYIMWMTTPSGQKRIANRKNPDRARMAIRLDDDDE
ncbi:hypothetical protein [Oceanobacillus sp. FSL W7-1309]|uniref:hypothetical protein n=1 Tax=Oceanobacillus sp. FSL W7-1309 TaxID=2954539 RepID=UPI0030F8883C